METLTSPAVPTPADLAALVAGVARKDRQAFQRLCAHFAPRLKSFLLMKGVTDSVADDVLQEALLSVWLKARAFDAAKARASTWIYTITRNKLVDRLRKDGRARTEELEPERVEADSAASDDAVFGSQIGDAVQAAMGTLQPNLRRVVFLTFMRGQTHSEIAAELKLPLGTVKSRLRRAYELLRIELRDPGLRIA